jgi:4-amino-4-deoxy-L-arabinose transferase-like glycosyltransferase
MRQTISAMAGRAGTDRWIMTGGILLVAGCYLVTAAGLTGARASARGLLTVAGLAGIGIATSPEPASGPTPQHLAWTVLGAVTIAVWPAFAARRTGPRPPILSVYGSAAVTAVFVGLLGWLLIETHGGSLLGLAERLTSSLQTSWPFVVAVALRRASACGRSTAAAAPARAARPRSDH